MTERARVGWVVDAQVDFMDPEGRLYVRDLGDDRDPGAKMIVGVLSDVVDWMKEHCEVVVYTGDWHSYDDAEIDPVDPDPGNGTYPPHCMGLSDDPAEREGALIVPAIRPADPLILEMEASQEEARKLASRAVSEGRSIFIHKNRFDVFEGNRATEAFLDGLFKALGRPLELFVVGVARDVCVTGAVDGMQARGLQVRVVRDAVWGLGLEPEEVTLARWAEKGEILTADQLPR
jgi:nicotinamidase-related amidase